MKKKFLRIALLGTRGIPASHGGFETCVEEVGARLVAMGHHVTVYSKATPQNQGMTSWKGMQIVKIPRIPVPGLETLLSTTFSVFHSLFCSFDFHMVFNSANGLALIPYRILRKPVSINTDGLEWKREKWGYFARTYYRFSEWFCARFIPSLVSDSQALLQYYKTKFNRQSNVIAYGANLPEAYDQKQVDEVLAKYGVKPYQYFFQVTRFEPENNPLLTAKAFKTLNRPDLKCILVGGANFETAYWRKMNAERSEQVILPGFIYERDILEILMTHSLAYVHGNSVGGTNPALLQAMAAARPILAIDCEFNRETLAEVGLFFTRSIESLTQAMTTVLANPTNTPIEFYQERIQTIYNWNLVAEQYESLFHEILNK